MKSDERVVVIKYDSGGRYTGAVKLDEKFDPSQLGVFGNGGFFASGVTLLKGGDDPQFSPYAAIFDASGRLVKRMEAGDPADAQPAGEREEDKNKGKAAGAPPDFSIIESDGTFVYLLRQGAAPVVYVVSPAGVVDRKLKLSPSRKGEQVSAMRIGPGQILLEYVRPNALPNESAEYELVLYDGRTGESVSTYRRSAEVSGTLACTDWRGNFSFVSSDSKGRMLLNARAR